MSQAQKPDLPEIVERGLAAVEADDLEAAEEALGDASKIAGENHVNVLHLAGMLAWAEGDLERAAGYLMQSADLGPDRADIYLDCAECLFETGADLEEAEAAVRVALRLPNIIERQKEEARLLLAQIRLADDDTGEALAVLDEIGQDLQRHPAYLTTRGAVLLAAGEYAEAIAHLGRAVKLDPDDPDFRYQLAITQDAAGDSDSARASMLRVLELDAAAIDEDLEPPSEAEAGELRSALEAVLGELPDPVLGLVANVPITVQGRASVEQVSGGIDPRGAVAFLGRPRIRNEDEAELTGMVVMRDLLLSQVHSADEIPSAMFYGLLEEVRRFFRREDLVVVSEDDE